MATSTFPHPFPPVPATPPAAHDHVRTRAMAALTRLGLSVLDHQAATWDAYLHGNNVLLTSGTGSGKTVAAFMAVAARAALQPAPADDGLRVLWITPMRALATDTARQLADAVAALDLSWSVETRTGDTSSSVKRRQLTRPPAVLVTTPESASLLLSYRSFYDQLATLNLVVVDEWHELLATKRGTQTELVLARLAAFRPGLPRIALSATIGNPEAAAAALTGDRATPATIIVGLPRPVVVDSLLPDTHALPWAGHYGLRLAPHVAEAVQTTGTSLVFTNTRAQAEAWYKALLEADADLAGQIALHHGSLDTDRRQWVEHALRDRRLKACVCTSTLDLGVDFPAVDRVFNVGSVGGVARLLQRAGRADHRVGGTSRVTCIPTYLLQLVEIAAARTAVQAGQVEARPPVVAPLDVLVQHLLTIASGAGLAPDTAFQEITSTWSYRHLPRHLFDWALRFAAGGGDALRAYEEYERMVPFKDRWILKDKTTTTRHRQAIGTIVSDPRIKVKYERGKALGEVEASFAGRLQPGDTFFFAGRFLEYRRMDHKAIYVRRAHGTPDNAVVPRWMGQRLPFTPLLGAALRATLATLSSPGPGPPEADALRPLLAIQQRYSEVPTPDNLLIERLRTREGFHLFVYPFEGRHVHEGLALLLAARLAALQPGSYRLSYNDYGLELLSDEPPPLSEALAVDALFAPCTAAEQEAILRQSQLARRHFREIARVAVLVHPGIPGRGKPLAQLQHTASLLYDVFMQYDADNPLLEQAHREAALQYLHWPRLQDALGRLQHTRLTVTEPPRLTPLALPLFADRLGLRLSNESLARRLRRLQEQMLADA